MDLESYKTQFGHHPLHAQAIAELERLGKQSAGLALRLSKRIDKILQMTGEIEELKFEVERLRALVESAYNEGFANNCYFNGNGANWNESESKKLLG